MKLEAGVVTRERGPPIGVSAEKSLRDPAVGLASETHPVAFQVLDASRGPLRDRLDHGGIRKQIPFLERIGGVTGWQRAAALAAVNRVEMSSHLFPEVSAHLLAATPTCHYLEYVDWANALVEEPLAIVDGCAVVPERPGNGLVWDKDAVARHRLE